MAKPGTPAGYRAQARIAVEVVAGIVCPQGHTELVPGTESGAEQDKRWQIRPFRVCDADGVWWSKCLVCEAAGDEDGGWFA